MPKPDIRAPEQQSPIAIPPDAPVHLSGFTTNYRQTLAQLADDPDVVRFDTPTRSSATIGGTPFELLQFHFHSPAEHTLPHGRYEVEIHLVHEASDGRLAAIAAMLEPGQSNPALDAVVVALEGHDSATMLDPGDLLPIDLRHVSYTGSLTTPPFTPGVRWRVCLTPLQASAGQLAAIVAARAPNCRPLQPLVTNAFE